MVFYLESDVRPGHMQEEVKRDKNEVGLWTMLKSHSSTEEVKPEEDKYTRSTKSEVTCSKYMRKHIMYIFNKHIFQRIPEI